MFVLLILSLLSLLIWMIICCLPSQGYRFREVFSIDNTISTENLPMVSIVIPARNEEAVLRETLPSLLEQEYANCEIFLVNDQSTDNTKSVAESLQQESKNGKRLQIIDSKPLEKGWAGKMWALHQGLQHTKGEWILLTDADLQYAPNLLKSIVHTATNSSYSMFSLMARLKTNIFWEKLLIPAFLYFFKMMYPFQKVQDKSSSVAAAAGGCIFIKRKTLEEIGGIKAIQGALIDDISLAKVVKHAGNEICLMDGPDLYSMRGYENLSGIWNMVVRSAFTELKYSYVRLLACILIMLFMFTIPIVNLILPFVFWSDWTLYIALSTALTYGLIVWTYIPTIRYFKLSSIYFFALPFAAQLYLCMTIDSAIRYSLGTKASWKGREYQK